MCVPHFPQNFAPGSSDAPQALQLVAAATGGALAGVSSPVPQDLQNFAPSVQSAEHLGHFKAFSPSMLLSQRLSPQRKCNYVSSRHGEHPAMLRKLDIGPTSRRLFPVAVPSTQRWLSADEVAK